MGARSAQIKPARGMILAFTAASTSELADIPASVIDIWPRLPSDDYLVVLEYNQPVRLGNDLIREIGALVSELYVPCITEECWPGAMRMRHHGSMRHLGSGRYISGLWQRLYSMMTHSLDVATAQAYPLEAIWDQIIAGRLAKFRPLRN